MAELEPIGSFVEQMKAKIAKWAADAAEREAKAEAEHQALMQQLPPGTCEHCYGQQFVKVMGHRVPCRVCNQPIPHAEGVPHEFKTARFDNYREVEGNRTALTKARRYLQDGRDLYLWGGVGAGKTRLACTILNEWFLQRRMAYFVRVPDLLYRLQPGRDADEVSDLEQRVSTASLVVLDDVGAERDMATDYTRRTLLWLYERRGDAGLQTIWTSNKSLDDLAKIQDDDRLTSRIAGRSDVVKLTTPDQRILRRVK